MGVKSDLLSAGLSNYLNTQASEMFSDASVNSALGMMQNSEENANKIQTAKSAYKTAEDATAAAASLAGIGQGG